MGINQSISANLVTQLRKKLSTPKRGMIGNEHTAKKGTFRLAGGTDKFNEKGGFKHSATDLSHLHQPKGYGDYAKEYRKMITDENLHQSAKLPKEKKKHPGFKAVQGKIEKEGYSPKIAGAILASRTRHASKAAHKANPHLSRVKG